MSRYIRETKKLSMKSFPAVFLAPFAIAILLPSQVRAFGLPSMPGGGIPGLGGGGGGTNVLTEKAKFVPLRQSFQRLVRMLSREASLLSLNKNGHVKKLLRPKLSCRQLISQI